MSIQTPVWQCVSVRCTISDLFALPNGVTVINQINPGHQWTDTNAKICRFDITMYKPQVV
ncbi:unnamed protein product [Haemonchus placei]|uniref:MSP domain-containing protein n=1 Tax=Haemonchus placei TaxID=6290 RepID=A0A0N4WR10_HAEPC|nr:unnamed protein product [Haemonchus placei]